jgi:hypothetical protein
MTASDNVFETYNTYKNATNLFLKWLHALVKKPSPGITINLRVIDEWVNEISLLPSCDQNTLRKGVGFLRRARNLRMQGLSTVSSCSF